MKFTEAQLEAAIIELLGERGYPHVRGEDLEREPGEVLLKADLRKYLEIRYAADGITKNEISSIIMKVESLPASDLYCSNREFMKLVSDGLILRREDQSKRDLFIQLIDYAGLAAFRDAAAGEVAEVFGSGEKEYGAAVNLYRVVSQLEVSGYEKRIPDVVLYINGLPLVVFEFKSAIR